MSMRFRSLALAAAAAVVALPSLPASAGEDPNVRTYWNIQSYFGVVPKFFHLFPEAALPAMWKEFRDVELNPNTDLDGKTKQLIAVAVATEAGCSACIYFHSAAALANGASGKELQEAVAVAVIGGQWSKVLTQSTFQTVKTDTNVLTSIGTLKMKARQPATTN